MKNENPHIDLHRPFDVHPIEGFEAPRNEQTGDAMPHCCRFHQKIHEIMEGWFAEFPFCCDKHTRLAKTEGFKKERYQAVPLKIMTNLIYTEYHIFQRIGREDWYRDITNYIEYNVHSFGPTLVGSDRYLLALETLLLECSRLAFEEETEADFFSGGARRFQSLLHSLRANKNDGAKSQNGCALVKMLEADTISKDDWPGMDVFPREKIHHLIVFIQRYNKPPVVVEELDYLRQTYHKWLAAFPDLEYFQALKEKYGKQSPFGVAAYDPHHNPYLGTGKISVIPRAEFMELLKRFTKEMLNSVDTTALIKNGTIAEADRRQLELAVETHRIRQSNQVGAHTPEEMQYRQIIEQWLERESAFFQQIAPLFKKMLPAAKKTDVPFPPEPTKDPSFTELFRSNEERSRRFFRLLKRIHALDADHHWIYNSRKSSIVACFQALEDLGFIKENLPKSQLQRIVASQIHFSGNEKLFRNAFSDLDYRYFKRVLGEGL